MNKNSKVLNLKKTTLVVTSINKRNEAIKKFEKLCKKNNTDFIFVADKKTPKFKYGNDLKFLSLKDQESLPFKVCKKIPINSYSRKNIGYLYSILRGAKEIYETDDDNYPKKNFFSQNIENLKHYRIKENGFINIYKYFLNKKIDIWPRGLPLSKIKTAKKSFIELKIQSKKFSIIQRLCDENPDVDAIYRLINKKIDIKFDKNKSFYVNNKSYIPFNSQNTIWFKEAFPLMYLPTYCTMRATDIWRSYIATHIMNKLNMKILFTSSTVYQKRNIHNLYNDFKLEIPVYIDVENLIKELNTIKIYNAKDYMLINLFNCYKKLVDKKFFDKRELKLIKLWCEDISEIDPNYIKV
jgi:hypothetical protein